jgi:hypothetical protein
MKNKDLFSHYETFDALISQILQMFENNDFCRKFRLHQNFVYMIFLDLVKIYNVFYIMTMETLDRYRKMNVNEMTKALVMYQNFCNFTESLKKQANTIPMMFGFTFKEPSYYKPDANKERAMKNALKDKEAGGDGDEFGDEDFGDEMPEFREPEFKNEFMEEAKDSDDGDSDEDYQFDLLGDVKKQEQMASVHGAKRSNTMSSNSSKKQRIKVDEFNTAALDDLLGAQENPKNQRSGTMGAVNNDDDEEWDPFGGKQENVYSTQQQPQSNTQPQSNQNQNTGNSDNIFGDDDNDMWGGNNQTPMDMPSNSQQTRQDQKQTLDDILGGDEDQQPGNRSQSMAMPGSDYNMLKNLYNTAAPQQQQMNMGGGQQDYYNTGMPNNNSYGGMGDGGMGGGYNNQGFNTGMNPNQGYGNQNYGGGMGYNQQQQLQQQQMQQQQQYNTSYGGGYNQGYNNSNPAGNQSMGGGLGYDNGMQNNQFNTAAPNQNNQSNNDFDPFS